MRTAVFFLCMFLATSAFGEDKIYFPIEKLSFTEQGIFLKNGKCVLELPFIGYDAGGYYLSPNSRSGATIVQCAACRYNTWWVERHCCLREDCVYSCY